MKRQIFTLLMVFVLAMGTALVAQTTGTSNSQLPPSQQVDETNKPETGPGPDVDVDLGRNADNGVADVDVDRQTDPDTSAQGDAADQSNLNNTNSGTTGTTSGVYGDTDTGMAGDNGSLPGTASDTPLLGLIGLLSLGVAFTLRAIR